MNTSSGRIAVIGAGPAGLAAALALGQKGFAVTLYERHSEIRSSGNVVNLWSAPQKVLRVLGVDIDGMGAAARVELRRADGRVRAKFVVPDEVMHDYNLGFIGLLRYDLYQRMAAALPEGVIRFGQRVQSIADHGDRISVTTDDGTEDYDLVVGADGIDSVVRKHLWGDAPKRDHRLLGILGYVFDESATELAVWAHDKRIQGSYTPMLYQGRRGFGWWTMEPWEADQPLPTDPLAQARRNTRNFSGLLPSLVARTEPQHVDLWQIRDRPALDQWSKGRATLAGDAAHPTSPYAAYGAGMSIEDGYFLARLLDGVDITDRAALEGALSAYEQKRRPHTTEVCQGAFFAGKMFHHPPRLLRPVRDFVFDHTSVLQKQQGEALPSRSARQLEDIEEPRERPTRQSA